MSRISIDKRGNKHEVLKDMAALHKLEKLLNNRIRDARKGAVSRCTAKEIFGKVVGKLGK